MSVENGQASPSLYRYWELLTMTGGNCKTSQVSRGPGEQVYKEGSRQAAVKKTDKLGQRTKSTKTSG